ncbi:MAG: hypothetical protein SFX74_05760 [Fimbriimonadaceae bacterium]|nr:hypothetical protein [Fimbriimonadaceae bacterium]
MTPGSEWSDGRIVLRWQRCGDQLRVTIESDFVRAVSEAPLLAGEIARFRAAMAAIDAQDAGSCTGHLLDDLLRVTCAMAKRDELHVTIRLRDSESRLDEVTVLQRYPRHRLRDLMAALPEQDLGEDEVRGVHQDH